MEVSRRANVPKSEEEVSDDETDNDTRDEDSIDPQIPHSVAFWKEEKFQEYEEQEREYFLPQ